MRTLRFDPGTRFSDTSLNFRLLGDLLADRLDRRLSDLAWTHLFNHMTDARAAALEQLDAVTSDTAAVYGNADGAWLEEETGVSDSLVRRTNGRYELRYLSAPETLLIDANRTARFDTVRLEPQENCLRMVRPMENRATTLRRLEGAALRMSEGSYLCDDFAPSLDGRLKIVNAGRALYCVFSGAFRSGRVEQMRHVRGNVWVLPSFRALDATPPRDWTISMNPDGSLIVGCWFARGLRYRSCWSRHQEQLDEYRPTKPEVLGNLNCTELWRWCPLPRVRAQ